LENAFPDAASLLIASRHFTAADSDVLVVLDTNVLMLPFEVSKQDLAEIEKVFSTLASEGRLFVPGRVIREFINRRDKRLAEIVQGMFDKSSIAARKIETPPILEGLALTDTATSAFAGLEKSQKQYVEAVRALASVITGWRGNDPVTAIYSRLFDGARVVELPPDRADQEKQWVSRLKQKTPPGYKDAGKPDTGVGDFLIWLSLLQLGDTHGKDLIFVTGEEKADWFVRSNKTGVYPRPELIAEYRQRSKGKDIQLAKLADVLEQMKAPEAVVSEVRTAERAANSAVQFSSLSTSLSHQHAANEILASNAHLVSFDYSTNNGEIVVGSGDAAVTLKFSKSGDRDIQFMKWADSIFIARLKNAAPGQVVQADEFDHTSSMYRIQNGEAFLARNKRGYTLAGRIVSIADDTRHNAPEDNVSFLHSIYAPDQQIVLP
ncbi:MAG: hypothetical protein JWO19_6092, partial [Bryobacterales bacterium]|nr:hypothetical protein [Bryobacterales bacterium]